MSGTASSESILFIGAVVAAAALVGALMGTANALAVGMENRADILADRLEGRMEIVNDPRYVQDTPLTLYIKNTGTVDFYAPGFLILLDGEPSADWTTEVGGVATDVISPGEVATIVVNDLTVAAGDHHVVVVTDKNQKDDLEFTS